MFKVITPTGLSADNYTVSGNGSSQPLSVVTSPYLPGNRTLLFSSTAGSRTANLSEDSRNFKRIEINGLYVTDPYVSTSIRIKYHDFSRWTTEGYTDTYRVSTWTSPSSFYCDYCNFVCETTTATNAAINLLGNINTAGNVAKAFRYVYGIDRVSGEP